MNGRDENNKKIEISILNKIDNLPDIIKDYYYSLQDKTAMTKRAYIDYIIEFYNYFKENDFNDIKPKDINRYLETKVHYRTKNGNIIENKESIRNVKLSAIKNFYKFLLENGYVVDNIASKINPPSTRYEKEIIYLTPEEIKNIEKNIICGVGSNRAQARQKEWRNRDLALITLGFSTGLRCSALIEINLSDVDFDNNSIKVTEKGNVVKYVYFGESTKKTIEDWLVDRMNMNINTTEALFVSNRKTRLNQRSVARIVDKYTYDIDKHITPHKLRSTCAMNLYEATNDIYLVSEVLGHKSVDVTRKYARASKERKRNAAEILDSLI